MRKVSLKRKRNGVAENEEEAEDLKNTSGEKENGDEVDDENVNDDEKETSKNDEENDNDDESDAAEEDKDEKETPKKKAKKAVKAKNSKNNEENDNDDEGDAAEEDEKETPKKKAKKAAKAPAKKGGKKNAKAAAAEEEKDDAEEEEEEEEEYEVEDIIDHKVVKGKTQYLIRWKGWGEDGDTWEAEATLSCPDIVAKYKEKQGEDKPEKKAAKGGKGKAKAKGRPKGKGAGPKKGRKNADADEDENEDDENGEDDDTEYEVDRIMDVHFKKNGSREFLIRWKGWGSASDTWEPEEHLNCTDLIEKYMKKCEDAKSKSAKELRVERKRTDRLTLSTQSNARRLSKRNDGRQRAVYFDAE